MILKTRDPFISKPELSAALSARRIFIIIFPSMVGTLSRREYSGGIRYRDFAVYIIFMSFEYLMRFHIYQYIKIASLAASLASFALA